MKLAKNEMWEKEWGLNKEKKEKDEKEEMKRKNNKWEKQEWVN